SFADHFSQARMFFHSQSAVEQSHMASALVFELSKVQTPAVREAVVGQLQHIDQGLAERVAKGLGMAQLPPPPPAAQPAKDMPISPALRLIDRMKPTLAGRCIGLLVADGSNAESIAKIRHAVEQAGATLKVVAPRIQVQLNDGSTLAADGQLAGTPS